MSERLTNKKIKAAAAAAAAGKEVFHCAYETTRVLRVLRELAATAAATSHQLSPFFCVPSASSLPANSAAAARSAGAHRQTKAQF